MNPIEILLVEDNSGDVRLTQEALKEAKVHMIPLLRHPKSHLNIKIAFPAKAGK
jgi:hypothetical protein